MVASIFQGTKISRKVRFRSRGNKTPRRTELLIAAVTLAITQLFAPAPARAELGLSWLTQYGTAGNDAGDGIVVDSLGQIWVGGYTAGSLGSGNAGGTDLILSRLSANGTIDFTLQRGGSGYDQAVEIALYGSGNIFAGVRSSDGFDSQSGLGGEDAAIVRYDTAGNWLGTTRFGGSANDSPLAAAGSSSHLLLAGGTTGPIDGQSHAGGLDAFISLHDEAGSTVWTRLLGTSNSDYALAATFDATGAAYAVGYTGGNLAATAAGSDDIFLVRYDIGGTQTLLTQFGGEDSDVGRAMKVDLNGNIYLTGNTYSSLAGETNHGGSDAFVMKLDSSGNILWTRLYGSGLLEQSEAIAIDDAGRIWIGGVVQSYTTGVDYDAFVAAYDENGNLLDSRVLAGTGNEQINGIATGPDGIAYLTGYTSSNLGGTYAGAADVFVAKAALVPEPGANAALLLGASGLFSTRRFRRR